MPTKRITYANQKGGATKSTQALCNSIAGTQSEKRVLAVDLDHGQGNLTYAFGYPPLRMEHTAYSAMKGESSLDDALLPTYYDKRTGIFFDPRDNEKIRKLNLSSLDEAVRGPDLLPMNPDKTDGADIELVQRGDWGLLLSNLLDEVDGHYDEIHIDTNPDIKSVFPKVAVYAASDVVIPATPENWDVQGMIMLARFIMSARGMNEHVSIAGVVFSRVRYAAHREVIRMTNEEVVPAINTLFEQTRAHFLQARRPRAVQQLDGLQMHCFAHMISESREYSDKTKMRSTVLTSRKTKKTEFAPALEQWQCYIELLQCIGGANVEQAVANYNTLVAQYEQAH